MYDNDYLFLDDDLFFWEEIECGSNITKIQQDDVSATAQ